MRLAVLLSLFVCLAVWAAPKRRPWQDAELVKVEQSVIETEAPVFSQSISTGTYPATTTGVDKRRTKVWTYAFKTTGYLYVGKVTGKPLKSVKEGDRVRVAVQRGELYIMPSGGKEQKLELLKSE